MDMDCKSMDMDCKSIDMDCKSMIWIVNLWIPAVPERKKRREESRF